MPKPIIEDLIDMIESDVKKAVKEAKFFIENPKNVKEEQMIKPTKRISYEAQMKCKQLSEFGKDTPLKDTGEEPRTEDSG